MYYNHNSDSHFITFTILIIVFFISFYVIYEIRKKKKKRRIDEILDDLASNNAEITPEEFIALRNEKLHGYKYEGYYALTKNFAGIYILHNITKDKYYVGQSKYVLNRVNMHLTGKGNGDVYFDYRLGDQFTIRMISLENSGFSSLNSLEKNAIAKYHAYTRGYNKTRGND